MSYVPVSAGSSSCTASIFITFLVTAALAYATWWVYEWYKVQEAAKAKKKEEEEAAAKAKKDAENKAKREAEEKAKKEAEDKAKNNAGGNGGNAASMSLGW
jgi:type VI protein secretion system component VasK